MNCDICLTKPINRENIWEAWSLACPVLHMASDLQADFFIS